MKRATEIVATVFVLGAFFVWNEGLLRSKVSPDDRASPKTPYGGATVPAELRAIPETVEIAATVRPRRAAALSSRVVAVVQDVIVSDGARVQTGQTLVRLMAPDLDAKHTAASAAVHAAEAADAEAKREFERVSRLQEKGVATRRDRERVEARQREAASELARAVAESRAMASVAGYRDIVSPFDGVVTRRRVDPGALASPGGVLVEVADDSGFVAEAEVSESLATRLHIGDPAAVEIDALRARIPGRITEVVPSADPNSRTMRVKVDLGRDERFVSGLFARVKLSAGEHDGIVVPEASIRSLGEGSLVSVVSAQGELETRWVRLGRRIDETNREVLAGVAAHERLAVP